MQTLKSQLKNALSTALHKMEVDAPDVMDQIAIQEVPEGKAGDYGSPVAFGLAKTLRKNPAAIAQDIIERLDLPYRIQKAEAVGPYINFFVDPSRLRQSYLHK